MLNLLSSLKLKVRPSQIKRMLFFKSQFVYGTKRDSGWRLCPLLLTIFSFLCSSSFKSFIKNNRNSCSFNFYNNNMLGNSRKRYWQNVFYFETTNPMGPSSDYLNCRALPTDRTMELTCSVLSFEMESCCPVCSEVFLESACLPPHTL